jgi:hypothetical protein
MKKKTIRKSLLHRGKTLKGEEEGEGKGRGGGGGGEGQGEGEREGRASIIITI